MKSFITDYNVISPLGLSREAFKDALLNGRCGISQLPENDILTRLFNVRLLGLIPNQIRTDNTALDDHELLKQKEIWLNSLFKDLAELSDLDCLILVHNSGPSVASYYQLQKTNTSFVYTEESKGIIHAEAVVKYLKEKKNLSSRARVINFHNTCSSGAAAVTHAHDLISGSFAKRVLIIGFEVSNNNYYILTSLASLGVMNTKATNVSEGMLPFDSRRSGFVKADGLVYILVEGEAQPLPKRIARIRGGALSADAHSLTDGIESGEQVSKTIEKCLEHSDLNASEIDYVNAHGSGTYLNDTIEYKGLRHIFNDRSDLIVSSTKSYFGHALCVTGLIEIASICAMFEDKFVVGNINSRNIDKDFNYQFPVDVKVGHTIRYALKNSFGFGGYNSSVLLENIK
jgi:3-oxoacyl-[acyl-carrier-protein] synthase II